MKATDKQQKVCDAIVSQIKYWRDTNDLFSPTHDCDIEDCVWAALEGVITDREIHTLVKELDKILQFVRGVEHDN